MKEKKHSQSVQPVQCENLPEVHSIADQCSMKEKNHGQSVQCVQFENVPAVHSIGRSCSMKEKITVKVFGLFDAKTAGRCILLGMCVR